MRPANSGSASRTPWSAIAPSVENAASASGTPSGTRAARFTGTQICSAWLATFCPQQATRSPTWKWSPAAGATASTVPADE